MIDLECMVQKQRKLIEVDELPLELGSKRRRLDSKGSFLGCLLRYVQFSNIVLHRGSQNLCALPPPLSTE